MKAAELLAIYERVADVPDAVVKLRQLVVDLAVQGKLVPQLSGEEPANDLLCRIASVQNLETSDAKQEKAIPTLRMPVRWAATTIGNYARGVFTGPFGTMLQQSDYVFGGVPLVNPSHMKGDRIVPEAKVSVSQQTAARLASYALQSGDIVMARRGEVGRAALVEPSQAGWLCGTGSFFLRFSAEVNRAFFLLQLKAVKVRAFLSGNAVGSTMVNLNHGILARTPLLIPPREEQDRILAKVDELMALCDQLEAARTERETARDRLAAASLARLNAPDPDTFQADARFAINVLPAVSARPDQVKQLRQTILNLAVRGKLVPQQIESGDTNASITCDSEVRDGEFEIPKGWRWATLSELGSLRGGATPSKVRPDFWNGSIPWVSPKDMKRDYLAG